MINTYTNLPHHWRDGFSGLILGSAAGSNPLSVDICNANRGFFLYYHWGKSTAMASLTIANRLFSTWSDLFRLNT